jgi:hypothetical protein
MTLPAPTEIFREGFYLPYPHSNGFCRDGRHIVLGKVEGTTASLWRCSLEGRDDHCLGSFDFSGEEEKLVWFDVARGADRLIASNGQQLRVIDVVTGERKSIYRAESPAHLMSLTAINAAGTRVLVGLRYPDRWAALEVDVDSGKSWILFEHAWYLNHFHYSPHDETWIGFCHEGACESVSDRVWGWHAMHAPKGRCLFNQNWGDPKRELCAGHERWSFHADSVIVVAYGASPGRPRGIYEAFADRRAARLISEGNRDLHVNISASGRWIALDTSGPHDRSGRGWENADGISDVHLLDAVSGKRRWLARTRITSHPSHPHPVFSPDEQFVFYNEATEMPRGNRVRRVRIEGAVL